MKNEPRICNYLDIPLQHISDPILKSMKRDNKTKTTDLIRTLENTSEIAIRTMIAGYPVRHRGF